MSVSPRPTGRPVFRVTGDLPRFDCKFVDEMQNSDELSARQPLYVEEIAMYGKRNTAVSVC
jgi:hypothetical protein